MEDYIRERLADIEDRNDVTILYASESGSRAWGFASKDSDYDVRFIYVHKKERYLRLEPFRDVIEVMDGALDASGWDLRKSLRLLHNSNPSLFEWMESPVVYKSVLEFARFRRIAAKYFSPRKTILHYLSLADGEFGKSVRGMEMVRLKSYLYVVRALLASRWIMRDETPPPIAIDTLMDLLAERRVKSRVSDLISIKRKSKEREDVPAVPELNDFIERELSDVSSFADSMEDSVLSSWEPINEFFLELVENDRFLF